MEYLILIPFLIILIPFIIYKFHYRVYTTWRWEDETGCNRSDHDLFWISTWRDGYFYARDVCYESRDSKDEVKVTIVRTIPFLFGSKWNQIWYLSSESDWSKDGR